jgi:hypothetical protein
MQIIQKTSLILRLWCVEGSSTKYWRAAVEITETGERIGFASLEQLFAYLIDLTEKNNNRHQNTLRNPDEKETKH